MIIFSVTRGSRSDVRDLLSYLGKGNPTKTDEFSDKFQTAFDPPLIFGKSYCGFRDKSAYVHMEELLCIL